MDLGDESIRKKAKLTGQVNVAVRIRPLNESEVQSGNGVVVEADGEKNVVEITRPGRKGAVLRSEMGCIHKYTYDLVFGPKSSQQEVYVNTAKPLVAYALDGINSTVFAYGATGSGKTFTMLGLDANNNFHSEHAGIIPQAMTDLFLGIKERQSTAKADGEEVGWEVFVSYLEVYNEAIFDLLNNSQRPLLPCEDPQDCTVKVLGLTEKTAGSVAEVMTLLTEGNQRRRMASTKANEFSSRSHAVLQVKLVCKLPPELSERDSKRSPTVKQKVRVSRLSLIDLAGSERAANTQNRGTRLREGASINKSLLALANCINSLSSKSKTSRVKYRDSKLTHLLKSSLEGNCKLCMIAAINPGTSVYEESHNTLKYAERAKAIRVKPIQMHIRELPLRQSGQRVSAVPREKPTAPATRRLEGDRVRRSGSNFNRRQSGHTAKKRRISVDTARKNVQHAGVAVKRRYSSVTYKPNLSTARVSLGRERLAQPLKPTQENCVERESTVPSSIEEATRTELEHLKLQNRTLATLAANVFERNGVDLRIEEISSLVQNAVTEALSGSDCEIDRLCTAYSTQRAQKSNLPKYKAGTASVNNDATENSPQKKADDVLISRGSSSCIPIASRIRVSNRIVGKLYRS